MPLPRPPVILPNTERYLIVGMISGKEHKYKMPLANAEAVQQEYVNARIQGGKVFTVKTVDGKSLFTMEHIEAVRLTRV